MLGQERIVSIGEDMPGVGGGNLREEVCTLQSVSADLKHLMCARLSTV